MTERVIENHTSFYLDILFGGNAFLKRYQNRDSITIPNVDCLSANDSFGKFIAAF